MLWKRVDALKKGSLKELSQQTGIDCQKFKNQRTGNIIPKADDLYKIARALNTSMEYLLSGEQQKIYDARVTAIADWLSEDEGRISAMEKIIFGEKAGRSSLVVG